MKQLRINHVPHQCLAIDKMTIIKGCRFCQRYILMLQNLFANFLGKALNAKLKMIALSRIPDH